MSSKRRAILNQSITFGRNIDTNFQTVQEFYKTPKNEYISEAKLHKLLQIQKTQK